MKRNGCIFDYEEARNRDLMRAFHQYIASVKVIRLDDVWEYMARMPSARFWVSENRAAIVVASMMRGDKLQYMRQTKRDMFREIYKRVMELRKKNPRMSIYKCCAKVVNSPAPKFYMTPLSIRQTVYKIKRQWKKHQRLK